MEEAREVWQTNAKIQSNIASPIRPNKARYSNYHRKCKTCLRAANKEIKEAAAYRNAKQAQTTGRRQQRPADEGVAAKVDAAAGKIALFLKKLSHGRTAVATTSTAGLSSFHIGECPLAPLTNQAPRV